MIRMCDTTQTWKRGGFGLGRVRGGGEKGSELPPDGRGAAGCAAPWSRVAWRGGPEEPSPPGERQAEAVMVARLHSPRQG